MLSGFSLSQKLYNLAVTDSLTGLKNRRYFDHVIQPEIEGLGNLSYLMIDIDHFKPYNDRFGHKQGDKAIEITAEIIKESAKDDLAIRYGGEEFSVILVEYENPAANIYTDAEAIRGNIESRVFPPFSIKAIPSLIADKPNIDQNKLKEALVYFFLDGDVDHSNYDRKLEEYFSQFTARGDIESDLRHLQRLTVSIGGAVRSDGETVDELINRADMALYKAKEARNRVEIAK